MLYSIKKALLETPIRVHECRLARSISEIRVCNRTVSHQGLVFSVILLAGGIFHEPSRIDVHL